MIAGRRHTLHNSEAMLPTLANLDSLTADTRAISRQLHQARHWGVAAMLSTLFVLCSSSWLSGQVALVPNGSFESPKPPQGFPAWPQIDVWQKTPQPDGVPLPPGITWDQLAGVFPNTAIGNPDHIDNMDGSQAAYLFAIPGVGIYQELSTSYEAGKGYGLSLGALGAGGIAEGSALQIGLFYRDDANSLKPVAVTSAIYNSAVFVNVTHLVEFQALSARVDASDPWAGRAIQVGIFSVQGTGTGYWDLDAVRLHVIPEPGILGLLALGLTGLALGRTRSFHRK